MITTVLLITMTCTKASEDCGQGNLSDWKVSLRFAVSSCFGVSGSLLKFIFNVMFFMQELPAARRKVTEIFLVLRKITTPVNNFRYSPKVLKLVIHEHAFNYFKNKLNFFSEWLYKCKLIITNSATFLDIVCSQKQYYFMYCNLSSVLICFVFLALDKLSNYGFSPVYANGFFICLINLVSCRLSLPPFSIPQG